MRRALLVVALAALSVLGASSLAQAEPPALAPPAPAPVVDVESAENFALAYIVRNRGRLLGEDRRRVRVIDANAACLQHPIVAARFGCVFTLRALVIRRSRGWDGWDKKDAQPASRRGGKSRPRFRVRTVGCLGALRITGGPAVTPTATVPFIDCVRVRNGDYEAPEPVR